MKRSADPGCGSSYYLELTKSMHLLTLPLDDTDAIDREPDPEECLVEISWRIACWAEEDSAAVPVGRLKAQLIGLHRSNDPYQTLDSHSSELEELHSVLFTLYGGVLRSSVSRLLCLAGSDMFYDPILYVETIELEVTHRRNGVGLMAMDALLTYCRPHATLAFCKPFPMHRKDQRNSRMSLDRGYFDPKLARQSVAKGITSLSRYWARAGFRRLGAGPYHVVNLKSREPISRVHPPL